VGDLTAGKGVSTKACLSTALGASIGAPGGRGAASRRASLIFLAALALAITVSLGAASALADALPSVTIDAPTAVSYTSAHFSGTVNPNSGPSSASWHFELSETGEPGSFFQFDGGGEISGSQAEEADPVVVESNGEFLQPGHEYFVRLVASNEGGLNQVASGAEPFTTKVVAPPTVSIEPPTEITGTSVHMEGKINPGAPPGNPSAFYVDWRFGCTPICVPVGMHISADSSQHSVSADLTGLEPNTDYEVTLVASNAGGQASAGPVSVKTSQVPPAAQTLYAGSLGIHEATLAARVNPRNSSTTYQFEWGTDPSYGHVSPAAPQSLGSSDTSFHVVTSPLIGLAEGATYHYRVVATNSETSQTASGVDRTFTILSPSGPPTPCPNPGFRTGVASALPDCRAYEQVSPVEKNGADVLGYDTNVRAAANGQRVTFASYSGFDGAQGLRTFAPYVGSRGANGWGTSALYPPQEAKGVEFLKLSSGALGYSEQLTAAVVKLGPPSPVPGAEPGTENLYTRNLDTGAYTLLAPVGVEYLNSVGFDAGSSDFSHILFESPAKLTPEAPVDAPGAFGGAGPINLYESVGGEVRLVGILPNEEAAPEGARAGSASHFPTPVGGGGVELYYTQNTISADGTRIFWTDPSTGQLYARLNGAETVHVSASQRSEPDPEGTRAAFYRAATPDGSRVFFTSDEKLTDDSTASHLPSPSDLRENTGDLYSYDIDTNELADLTVAQSGSADVIGILGASDDGSFVYFAANGDPLADGAPSRGELFSEDLYNLYVWHDGQVGYISSLRQHTSDDFNWETNSVENTQPKTSRVTPGGRYLLFGSIARLTSYDNNGQLEFYRYDGVSHELQCVSCNPRNQTAIGGASLAAGAPQGQATVRLPPFLTNVISSDGSRVYFQTKEALVPSDGNGWTDVYEWQAGRDYLISSGQAAGDSYLGDAATNGSDVFFTTRQSMVGQDTDANVDMYDARVNGGIAAQNPPPAGAPCSGDACRTETGAAPPAAAPSSSTLNGPPNRRRHRHHGKNHRRDRHGGKHPQGRQGNGTRG
jgi:hypothetical protein